MKKIILGLLFSSAVVFPVFATDYNEMMKEQILVKKLIRQQYTEYKHTLSWPVEGDITAKFNDSICLYKGTCSLKDVPKAIRKIGMHSGLDISTAQGTSVKSAIDGKVAVVHNGKNGSYGYLTVINENGIATVYGHVSSILVEEKQQVKAGDIIALTGGTPGTDGAGVYSTGPHLHFEVLLQGMPFNPLKYLQ